MSRLLAEVPPNLGEHRRRLFHLPENPIVYSTTDWDVYWPFLDSIWLKNKHEQQSELGSGYKQSYTCRLANRKQPEEQRQENDAKRRRSRRNLTGCEMQVIIHYFKDTVQIHRQCDESIIHNHDLEEIDQAKKSTGLRNLVGRLAASSGGTTAASFRNLLEPGSPEEQEALKSIGASYLSVSDIHHAASVWRMQNQHTEDGSVNAYNGERIILSTPPSTHQPRRRNRKTRRWGASEQLSMHQAPATMLLDSSEPSLQGKLMAALEVARDAYVRRNPHSFRMHNESSQYMPGGNTRTTLHAAPFPLTFASGKGPELTSIDGDTHIDFLGDFSAGVFGHDNSMIRMAIQEAVSSGWNFGGQSKYEQQLAKTVCERFRPAMELVRFTNSGTEANMCAIATAVAWTSRKKVMVFDGGYHGSTINFSRPRLSSEMNIPHEWVLGSYDNIERTRAILQSLPLYSLAAVVIEPMQGNAGARSCNPEFLRFLRNYTTQFGICLIFDEVQTSRLSYQGLGQKLGIKPDLLTLGKWVGGGMSFGAFGGRKDIMDMFNPSSGKLTHGGTFNNNVFTMAAGCMGCTLLDERAISSLNIMGKRLKDLVHSLLQRKGVRGQMTQTPETDNSELSSNFGPPRMWMSGIGSILSLSFSGEGKDLLQALFYHHMTQEKIHIGTRGFIALSIEIREAHVDAFMAALEKFVEMYHRIISDQSHYTTEQQVSAPNMSEQPQRTVTDMEQPSIATNGTEQSNTTPSFSTPLPTLPNGLLGGAGSSTAAPPTNGLNSSPATFGYPAPSLGFGQWSVQAPVTAEWSGSSSGDTDELGRSAPVSHPTNSRRSLTFLSPQTAQSMASTARDVEVTQN